jgi:outer membrane protein TolC
LRGAGAAAEAQAASNDIEDMGLKLIESAQSAYYDYYLVHRAIEVNEENLKLLNELRKVADDRFRTAQAPEQDRLQADVEIGRQRDRGLALERMRKVAVARINTLMHLPPDAPLPSPPKELKAKSALPPAAELRAGALARRPDLQALIHRIGSDEAAVALAEREYLPDFEVMAAYDKFMGNQMGQMAPMVGVRFNAPLRRVRRHAAVGEAMARLSKRRAELDAQVDQVNMQVQEAYEQARESEEALPLYEKTVLPAARENVRAAQQAYIANRTPFVSLIEAQRNLVMILDRFYEIQADYFRRRANLERAIGGQLTP